jgi:hypothetical protein
MKASVVPLASVAKTILPGGSNRGGFDRIRPAE